MERKESEGFVKKVYVSEFDGPRRFSNISDPVILKCS